MASEKILWVVNYDMLDEFVDKSVAVGVTGVAIRSDNDLVSAIAKFHAKNIKVFSWRWPSAMRDARCLHEGSKQDRRLAQ